jgi:hypothetical protein
VKVRQGLRDFDRHRDDVQIGIDGLGIRTLVARNLGLRDQRVHAPALMALPWVGGTPQQCAPRSPPPCPLERRERAKMSS